MAGVGVEVGQVIEEMLRSERDADDEPQDFEDRSDEVDEADACGALDDFSSEALVVPAEEGLASDSGFVRISELDGVPLFFARGVPPRPQSFSIESGFRDVLTRTVKSVRSRAPESFGDLVRITSAGALVQKAGMHGKGRAFDHDAWKFEQLEILPIKRDHIANSLARRQRYWALAAIMRSHSAFVLHGHFNRAHEDHIHQDNGGTSPFSTTSDTTVKLAQAICNHIFGASPSLAIDGAFGDKSKAAVRDAMRTVDLPGDVFDSAQWRRFLLRSGSLGFRLSVHS
jgi:hypothetical protein